LVGSKYLLMDLTKPDDQQTESNILYDEVVDEMDLEINEMLEKGQKNLVALQQDFKKVSRMAEEPYANIRKVKQPFIKRQPENVSQTNFNTPKITTKENILM